MPRFHFEGPQGDYEIKIDLPAMEDARIEFTSESTSDVWNIETVEQVSQTTLISGMTRGIQKLWGDNYWFALKLRNQSAEIEYWLDQEIARTDQGALS